jgi:hypothetical protein
MASPRLFLEIRGYEALERRARTIEDYPEWRLKELYLELKKAA